MATNLRQIVGRADGLLGNANDLIDNADSLIDNADRFIGNADRLLTTNSAVVGEMVGALNQTRPDTEPHHARATGRVGRTDSEPRTPPQT